MFTNWQSASNLAQNSAPNTFTLDFFQRIRYPFRIFTKNKISKKSHHNIYENVMHILEYFYIQSTYFSCCQFKVPKPKALQFALKVLSVVLSNFYHGRFICSSIQSTQKMLGVRVQGHLPQNLNQKLRFYSVYIQHFAQILNITLCFDIFLWVCVLSKLQ